MKIINPEFRKNLWLELSTHRLVLTPIVVTIFLILVLLTQRDTRDVIGELFEWSALAATFIGCLGGFYMAATAMSEEYTGRTWDQQRLSPLSPWSLTWGKVFGSTSFIWYTILFFLLVIIVLSSDDYPLMYRLKTIILIIEATIMFSAVGLMTAITSPQKPKHMPMLLLIVILIIIMLANHFEFNREDSLIIWWGMNITKFNHLMLVFPMFTGWALLGAYRLIRKEMQFRNSPFVWLLFNLFLMVYLCGDLLPLTRYDNDLEKKILLPLSTQVCVGLLFSGFIGLCLCYVTAILKPLPQNKLLNLISLLKARRWKDSLEQLPLWGISLMLVVLITGIYFLISPILLPENWREQYNQNLNNTLLPSVVFQHKAYIIYFILFVVRDMLVFIGFTLGKKANRALITATIYLVVLNGFLFQIANLANLKLLASVLVPLPTDFEPWYIIFPVIEVGLVLLWIKGRIRLYTIEKSKTFPLSQ